MSTPIDEAQVRRIARLARLALTDEEVSTYAAQLGRIVEYVQQLEKLDLSGVEPLRHAVELRDAVRDDTPQAPLGSEPVLMNAAQRQGDFFRVPAVLDGDSG